VIRVGALAPYGRALHDHHAGKTDATMRLRSDLGEDDHIPASLFFRGPDDFFPFERAALDRCRGTVLDLGAGAGAHSLVLQERGLDVCAVDVVPEAVEVLRARGVHRVVQADFLAMEVPPADTVLMLMNGIGPVGTLDRLPTLFERVERLLRPGGRWIVDSGATSPREGYDPAADGWPDRTGDYVGEAWVTLEYAGLVGAPFRELYLESESLASHARAAGWRCQWIHAGEGRSYVAELTR